MLPRARRRGTAVPRAALSEYQDSLDRLRDLGGFDDDADLLELSLPSSAGGALHAGAAAATPEPAISPTELAVFERFVELLSSRQEVNMLRLAKQALNRAHTCATAGGEPWSSTADFANLARSSETTSFARHRVAAGRMQLLADRHALEQQQMALSGQRKALDAERHEFEWVKAQLTRSLPDGAAARLQAQRRAVQARLQYLQMRADAGAQAGRERERAAAAALARAGRQCARREQLAALRLQCALRRRFARGRAEAARGEMEGRRGERAAQLEAGRARVRARLEAREKLVEEQEAARKLQAAPGGCNPVPSRRLPPCVPRGCVLTMWLQHYASKGCNPSIRAATQCSGCCTLCPEAAMPCIRAAPCTPTATTPTATGVGAGAQSARGARRHCAA